MAGEEVEPRTPTRPQDAGAPAPSSGAGRARRRLLVAGGLVLLGVAGGLLARRLGGSRSCGDGQLDSGEECDDGNDRSDDGCLPDCRRARCGDGVVRLHVEECDDGNRVDGDGCTVGCLACPVSPTQWSWQGNGHCYFRVDAAVTFDEAVTACGNAGAHLVSYADDHEWEAVTDHLKDAATPLWIGLRKEERSGMGEFAWVSGERVLSAHWTVHEPRRMPAHLDCGVQLPTGAWASSACDDHRAYVCERPAWVASSRSHHLYRNFVGPATWPEARDACAAAGGHLVTLKDHDEHAWVTTQFQGFLWLGARLDEPSGKFRWISDEPLGYADFAPGEPDLPAAQKCLALDLDRRWYSRECDEKYNFICEVE